MIDATQILSQIERGDPGGAEQLFPLVYVQLRRPVRLCWGETVVALEYGEPGFLHRLKTLREKQMLTYQSRGNLLENGRASRDDGEALRNKMEKTVQVAP